MVTRFEAHIFPSLIQLILINAVPAAAVINFQCSFDESLNRVFEKENGRAAVNFSVWN